MSHRWIAAPVCAAIVVTGCGAGPPLPPAAEPARAPVPTVAPVGRTVPVGAFPEGVVVDPRTRIVAVGVRDPFALTLLDATTGAVLRKVPLELSTSLPERLRHLRLAGPGGAVLVPDAGANRLLRVALPGGEVTSQVVTGVVPRDVTTAANGTEFMANGDWHNLVAVRGDQIEHRFFEVANPAGLAAVGDLVGMVDAQENTLTVYDAERLERIGELPAGAGPTHVVADRRGHLVVIDTRGGAVLRYELSPQLRQIGRIDLPGTPYGVAYDPVRDRLWVTLTARNEVVGLDLAADPPVIATRLPTVRQPNTVAVDSGTGRLFVTGTDDGVLQIIEGVT